MNDLNEFLIQTFREAEISESEESRRQSGHNPDSAIDVDAFDYIKDQQKKKKHKKLTKTQKKQRQQFLSEASNVLMPESESSYNDKSSMESDDSYYGRESDSDDISRKIFGKDSAESRSSTIYCAYCAGRHAEHNCSQKSYKQNNMQRVRDNFAKETSYQTGNRHYSTSRDFYERGYDRRQDHKR